jgi:hypothetical protein
VMTEYNLDTSVLMNALYARLPGNIERDLGASKLLSGPDYCVICGHAEKEFNRLCDRRYELYQDITEWMNKTGESIFHYEPDDRPIDVSKNDRRHLRSDIKMSWHDTPRREQLSILRRCHQQIMVVKIRLLEALNEVLQTTANSSLLAQLRGTGIEFDANVVAESVEIKRSNGIDTLVAKDGDLVGDTSVREINDIIARVEGSSLELSFTHLNNI